METVKNKFQSYLILGSNSQRQAELNVLLSQLGLDFSASSPDFFEISSQKKSPSSNQTSISIDEIRNLKKHIFQKPVSAPSKVVIIKDANNLTIEAQNAILKILEEPPKHAIIILEAENEHQLLGTIISRVVKIKSLPNYPNLEEESFIDKSCLDNLMNLQTIDNPLGYLDEQILILYKKLLKSINIGDLKVQKSLKIAIYICVNSKKMIDANVNPKFVLASQFLSLQKQS